MYKVGDSKEFKGDTYYFCDAPNHRFKTKWHKHQPDKCRLRKAWLKDKDEKKTPSKAEANAAELEDNSSEDTSNAPEDTSSTSRNSDITSLLASAMNLATDNEVVKNLIAEALNATNA